MIVHVLELDGLRLRAGVLYVILPYSNGDTFNALLYLQKHPPEIPYQMVVKKNQAALATLLLERFDRQPEHLHIVNNFALMATKLRERFPDLSWHRGMIARCNRPGCLLLWDIPSSYHLNWQLDAGDIAAWGAYFSSLPCDEFVHGDALIFSMSASAPPTICPDFAQFAACISEHLSVSQYSNVSGIQEYGHEYVPGTTPISPRLDELLKLAYRPHARTYFIGLRSGLFDLVRFSNHRKAVFYSDELPGLYERMRFELMQSSAPTLELRYGRDVNIRYPELAEAIARFFLE